MTKYNEQQLIEVLQNEGLTVTQVDTKHYIDKGYIQTGNPLKSLLKTALQVFADASVTGRGKKRVYTVGERREEIAKRVDGRENNQYVLSREEEEIKEVIYNDLHHLGNNSYSIGRWAEELEFPIISNDSMKSVTEKMASKIEYAYNLTNDVEFFNSDVVVREHVANYNLRVKNIVEKSFERLHKEGLITYKRVYKGVSSGTREITADEYKAFKEHQTELIKASGYTFNKYLQMLMVVGNNLATLSDESVAHFITVNKEIEKELEEEYGFKFVYVEHEVELEEMLSDEHIAPFSVAGGYKKGLFNKFYLERTKKYRYDNNKENYAESTYFWRAFFYSTANILLDGDDKEIKESFGSDLEKYVERYELNYGIDSRHELPWGTITERKALAKANAKAFMDEYNKELEHEAWVIDQQARASMNEYTLELAEQMAKELEEEEERERLEHLSQISDVEREQQLRKKHGVPFGWTVEEWLEKQKEIEEVTNYLSLM